MTMKKIAVIKELSQGEEGRGWEGKGKGKGRIE